MMAPVLFAVSVLDFVQLSLVDEQLFLTYDPVPTAPLAESHEILLAVCQSPSSHPLM
jgi:hypothetical protein